MSNVIGKIPEFTQDALPAEQGQEMVAESATQTGETQPVEEKETPSEPSPEQQPATEETPSEDVKSPEVKQLEKEKQQILQEVAGLREARKEIISELGELRGQKKLAKQAELDALQDKIDDLKDLHPQDVEVIDRVLKAKGYVSKESVNKMLYEARKQEEVAKFLEEFREYSEENDPDKKKFGPLLKEVSLYKEPEDPKMWGTILRRAHKALAQTQAPSDRNTIVKKRQIEIAGVGAGGVQRSSSVKPFNSSMRQRLLDGGWSEEEIQKMEQRQNT